jgi:hypothetical protein
VAPDRAGAHPVFEQPSETRAEERPVAPEPANKPAQAEMHEAVRPVAVRAVSRLAPVSAFAIEPAPAEAERHMPAAPTNVASTRPTEQSHVRAHVAEPRPVAAHAENPNGETDRSAPPLRARNDEVSHPGGSMARTREGELRFARAASPAAPAAAVALPHRATAVETHAIARAIVARDLPAPGAQPKPPAGHAAKGGAAEADPRRTSSADGAAARDNNSRTGTDGSPGRGPAPRPAEATSATPSTPTIPIAIARAADAPTPATAEAEPPRLTPGTLVETIVSQARALPGTGTVQVHFVMEPAELGAVKVRIQTRGHEVRVDIAASSSGVASALAEGIPRLTAQLELAGYRQPEVSLTLDLSHNGRGANADRGAEPGTPRHHPRHHARASGPMRTAASGALDRTI